MINRKTTARDFDNSLVVFSQAIIVGKSIVLSGLSAFPCFISL